MFGRLVDESEGFSSAADAAIFAKERFGKSAGIVAGRYSRPETPYSRPNGWVYNKAERKAEKGRFFSLFNQS